jgi:DnaJ-class molecular chaperone with C-terminal Zn finger domain
MKSQTSFASSTASSSSSTDAATALHILLSPDGYYTYLGIVKPQHHHSTATQNTSTIAGTNTNSKSPLVLQEFDRAVIQKNYRRLSLRLHPDRPTGDEEAFRVLERAKNVLLNDKLRKQYDLLGLDLEDDDYHDESHQEDEYGNTMGDLKKSDDIGGTTTSRGGDDEGENPTSGGGSSGSDGGAKGEKSNGVLSHMASATVAALLQLAVRTGECRRCIMYHVLYNSLCGTCNTECNATYRTYF